MLEHSGKLQKNIHITISSPFEQYLERKQLEPSKEVFNLSNDTRGSTQNAELVPERIQQEGQHIDRELAKKKDTLERRRELYGWSRRAEAVGIAPMPPRRPTKGQRLEWEMSIIRAEDEQANAES